MIKASKARGRTRAGYQQIRQEADYAARRDKVFSGKD